MKDYFTEGSSGVCVWGIGSKQNTGVSKANSASSHIWLKTKLRIDPWNSQNRSRIVGERIAMHRCIDFFFLPPLSSMPRLSETCRFLQSSSFWEARRALIGQLSSALWLAEYLKRVTEMSQRNETKPINEAFVASSGDIITDYNDLYCLFTHCIAPCKHKTMSAFVIGETTNNNCELFWNRVVDTT